MQLCWDQETSKIIFFKNITNLTNTKPLNCSWNAKKISILNKPLYFCLQMIKYVTLEHKSSVESLGYICRNSQQYIVWVKIIDFYFMPKIISILRSCSMKIFCTFLTVNISKLNFWLLICIAKNFIWTSLKMIFSIFRFFCTLRFQIYKYCPNHTSLEIWFIQPL